MLARSCSSKNYAAVLKLLKQLVPEWLLKRLRLDVKISRLVPLAEYLQIDATG